MSDPFDPAIAGDTRPVDPIVADAAAEPTVAESTVAESTVAESTVAESTVAESTVAEPTVAAPSAHGPDGVAAPAHEPDGAEPVVVEAAAGEPATADTVGETPARDALVDVDAAPDALREIDVDAAPDALREIDVDAAPDETADLVAEPLEFDAPVTAPPVALASVGETSVADYLRAIEAVILVAHDPVAPDVLAQLIERPVVDVEAWCEQLAEQYRAANRGFELARVAGGYRYQTHADLAPYVERFLLHDQRARLSGAALETLAIVAYKQPISRAQIASIRGVDPDGVLRTLQSRGYIDAVGRDSGPGQAVLFGTTSEFLERLGLDSIRELPPIAEFIPGADVVEALEAGLRISSD